jgi:hypothetical protein
VVEVCCSGAGVLQWWRCAAVVQVCCSDAGVLWYEHMTWRCVAAQCRCVLQYIEHRVEAYCGRDRVEVCTAAHFGRVEA